MSKSKTNDYSESDMYKPVKDFFTGLGYTVNAEVKGCDAAMVKDGVLIIVELKKSFNMTLLYQAVDRQTITSQVYVAVPRPLRVRSKEQALTLKIVKKMELGLIYVAMDSPLRTVDIVCFPPPLLKTGAKKRRNELLTEMAGRSLDVNKGGQTRKPIATAYREKSIKIACILEVQGVLTPNELIHIYNCDKNVRNIFKKNYYQWFEPANNGCFRLSSTGIKMLSDESDGGEFAGLINLYRTETGNSTDV